MKFGKRLTSEAERKGSWSWAFFDYKALKKAIKDDIQLADAHGACFQRLLASELKKVSTFYSERVDQLEDALRQVSVGSQAVSVGSSVQQLTQLRADIKEMIKFVALNYLAVVKAIKKRNRHLREVFGASASTSLQALDLLEQEVFFTSPRLAALATQAEVFFNELASTSQASALEDYQCPICLDTMVHPVVLTCAHRFCWGCLVAHVTSIKDHNLQLAASVDKSLAFARNSIAVLEKIATEDAGDQQRKSGGSFPCPVCRQPQVADVDSLAVDLFLSNYIEGLRALSVDSSQQQPGPGVQQQVSARPAEHLVLRSAAPQWGILPPQSREQQGRLCVLLDLDGTLVSSFTPRRAPRLPPYVKTHVVGVGSKLNPQGVFVVERPGLREFLEQLSSFAEVIVFTAGLEDYAKPIIDAIDPKDKFFAGRIYREGTLRTDYYQCVKDMARLNRDLARTVLVDDTPLAFLHQPDNGVPVLGFRGDPDDRLLLEAVLPMMQVLSKELDVRHVLQRRFDMTTWFRRNSFPVDQIQEQALEAVRLEAIANAGPVHHHEARPSLALSLPCDRTSLDHTTNGTAAASAALCFATHASHLAAQQGRASTPAAFSGPRQASPTKKFLLLTDFDRTLTDCDAGESVVEQLAPELLPMLVGLDAQPTNFVPLTNQILGEVQRRGVSRDQLLTTLQQLGAEMPLASAELLRLLHSAGVDVTILSDCNSIFIGHMLAGAKVAGYVQTIVTNPASFERVSADELSGSSSAAATGGCSSSGALQLQRAAGHKLVIRPHYATAYGGSAAAAGQTQEQQSLQDGGNSQHICNGVPAASCAAGHGCPMCPDNLCKGLEVQRLLHSNVYEHIVYCGDGANDICAALALRATDVVLARRGYPLANYILESHNNTQLRKVAAQAAVWSTHEELLACVRKVMDL